MRNLLLCIKVACFVALSSIVSFAQEGPPRTEAEFEKQYRERITKDRINGTYIPKNLDDALFQLDKLVDPAIKLKIAEASEDTICALLHNRLGQWMILNWSFYEGSRLSHYLRSAGVTFPDDMSDFIILAFHRKLNNKPYTIKELATIFRKKRKQEHEEEIKEGTVIHQETKKRQKN